MYERYVTGPDGIRWVVGRRWLFGRPRYRGYRFGRKRDPYFEPARVERPATEPAVHQVRRSRPVSGAVTRGDRRAVYRDLDDGPWVSGAGYRRQRRSALRAAGTVARSSGSFGSGWGGGRAGSAGGGRSRGAGGGRSRGGSGGRGRSGGGAAAAGGGGLAALGSALGAALKWIFIVAVVAALAAFAIFVALPLLMFLLQLLLVGLLILWREATGRPYIVEAREMRGAPNLRVWKVVGLKQSRRVIDEVADALRTGAEPAPAGAEAVAVDSG